MGEKSPRTGPQQPSSRWGAKRILGPRITNPRLTSAQTNSRLISNLNAKATTTELLDEIGRAPLHLERQRFPGHGADALEEGAARGTPLLTAHVTAAAAPAPGHRKTGGIHAAPGTGPIPRAARGVRTAAARLWSPTGRPSPEPWGKLGWGHPGRAPSRRSKVENNPDTCGAWWTVEGTVSLYTGPPQHWHAHVGPPTAHAARPRGGRALRNAQCPQWWKAEGVAGARTEGNRARATQGTRERGICGIRTEHLYLNHAQLTTRECWHGKKDTRGGSRETGATMSR